MWYVCVCVCVYVCVYEAVTRDRRKERDKIKKIKKLTSLHLWTVNRWIDMHFSVGHENLYNLTNFFKATKIVFYQHLLIEVPIILIWYYD